MKKAYKNQIIIYVIAFMLVTAGYLNYTENNVIEVSSENKNGNTTDENIGDATLVNSNETAEENNENRKVEKEEKSEEDSKNETEENIKNTSATQNNNTQEDNDYFTYSKLEREKMYSQMLETYQKMLNNTNISEEQKSIASQEVKNINDAKNSIMICENLITTKGFEDVVMFINGDSINVVVKAEKLSQEQVAQIQNIVTREMNSKIDNIHIMTH